MLYTVYLNCEGVTDPTMIAVFLVRGDAENFVSNLPFSQNYKDKHHIKITNSNAWGGWTKIRECTIV